jgi:hypothetical protein
MFKKLAIGPGIQPSTELTGNQPSNDISVSGADAGVVSAGDMPPEQMNPPLPAPTPPATPPGSSPQGFGRLSVKQACEEIEVRARRVTVAHKRGDL